MSRLRYSIVIPAYNEERRIAATIEHILKQIAERNVRAEIIVVDDGSSDRTASVVLWYRRKTYKVKLLRVEHQGKGSAVRHGVNAAHGEIIFLCDADMHEAFEEAEKLEAALLLGADIAIGSRWVGEVKSVDTQPLYRRVCGRIFNFMTHTILGLNYRDTQCGLKAFTRDAARELFAYQTIDGWGFDPELLFVARRLGYKVAEVGITLQHDYSSSKFRPLHDGFITFKELFQILWRDMMGAYPRPAPETAAVQVAKAAGVGEQVLSPLPESGTREAA
ncbi:MAG: dolichyl-phosphate beta-glucosyltransferase [Terriglobales bacterium]